MTTIGLPLGADTWRRYGEHGVSSEAIFDRMVYGSTSVRWASNHPYDPDDFRRCELLLRMVPEFRRRLPEMAGESPVWARLVERWDEIAALMEEELPGVFDRNVYGRCEKAYAVMQECDPR